MRRRELMLLLGGALTAARPPGSEGDTADRLPRGHLARPVSGRVPPGIE
jgi:hypothetical protein